MEGHQWCTGGSGGNFKMTQTLTQMSLTQLLFFDTTSLTQNISQQVPLAHLKFFLRPCNVLSSPPSTFNIHLQLSTYICTYIISSR